MDKTSRRCGTTPGTRERSGCAGAMPAAGAGEDGDRARNLLGRWLWVLFWLLAAGIAAELTGMVLGQLFPQLPILETVDSLRETLFSALSGLVLLRLSSVQTRYCWAGICTLASMAATVATALGAGGEESGWSLLLELLVIVSSLVGAYHEFAGHGAVLGRVQPELAERWRSLWRWYLWAIGALMVALLLSLLVPILGLVISPAVLVVMVLLYLMRLVCLFQTAKCFRTPEKPGRRQRG